MNKPRFALIAGLAFFATVATSANAQDIVQSVSVKVYPYELVSLDGRIAVLDRLKRAASRACWSSDPLDGYRRRRCEMQVADEMVRQVPSPELLAQWKGRTAVLTASRN